jgi:hypothetical protein
LNKIQLKYIKYILSSPLSTDDIKQATRNILIENYRPWLHKQYRSFVRQNAKTMNRVYVRELYQYAIYGLLESLQNYNGSVGLHKYADKYVHGKMYKGMNELAILQPIKYSQMKNAYKGLKPVLVSYDDYWKFDKMQKPYSHDRIEYIKHIQEIMKDAPKAYQKLFYLRFDYNTLSKIRSIETICQLEMYSTETYRKKMNEIILYIREFNNNTYKFM